MSDERRRSELREFLMERRARVGPRQVGMPPGSRRRVAGLRREEVAEIAGVSADWYRYFESGRPVVVSPHFVKRISDALQLDAQDQVTLHFLAFGKLYDAHTAVAVEQISAYAAARPAAIDAEIRCIAVVRRLLKRIIDANNFREITELAAHAANDVLAPGCATIVTLNNCEGPLSGYAVGPRSQHWAELNDRVAYDANAALRSGGIGFSERLLTVGELMQEPKTRNSFLRLDDDPTEYQYECATQTWHDFNVNLRAGSCMAVPLFEAKKFRGIMALGWRESRAMAPFEIALAESIAAIVALAAG